VHSTHVRALTGCAQVAWALQMGLLVSGLACELGPRGRNAISSIAAARGRCAYNKRTVPTMLRYSRHQIVCVRRHPV
jgi:hypothetical protein